MLSNCHLEPIWWGDLTIANPEEENSYGKMAFNDEIVVMEELLSKFQNLPETSKGRLIIMAHRNVLYEQIIAVVGLAKQEGMGSIYFAYLEEDLAKRRREPETVQISSYGVIRGVVAALNGNPIAQTRIEYLGPGISGTVETNNAGNFEIIRANPGQYILRASKKGYKNREYTVVVSRAGTKIRNFQLLKRGEKQSELRVLPPFEVELPHSKFFEEFQVSRFIVYISATGTMFVDDEIIPTLDDLEKYMMVYEGEIDTLIIEADRKAKHGMLMDVIDRAKRRAIQNLVFAVEQDKAK